MISPIPRSFLSVTSSTNLMKASLSLSSDLNSACPAAINWKRPGYSVGRKVTLNEKEHVVLWNMTLRTEQLTP